MSGNRSRACPLCQSVDVGKLAVVQGRSYLDCEGCGLVHMSEADRPDRTSEYRRYQMHQNDLADPGYRRFLERLLRPLVAQLPAGVEGLDYGSGPGPTLSVMLADLGFTMTVYDPFFHPDHRALDRTYDFVTCTEVAEHFFDPRAEFQNLDRVLRPGGWLGVMTGLVGDRRFRDWWYVRDETHVAFYRVATMEWIANWLGWEVLSAVENVVLFRK